MAIPEKQHEAAVKLGAKCDLCPLVNSGQGPVMGEVRPRAILAVVGEAPGHNEVADGQPLVGASGDVLWRALDDGGVKRGDCAVTNAILCRPPGGNIVTYLLDLKREHKKALTKAKAAKKGKAALPVLHTPQECCAPRLKAELDAADAKTMLGVGNEGLKALAGYLKIPFDKQKAPPGTPRASTIKRQHGSPVLTPSGVTLTASLHPAFALHGSSTYLPIIREDLQRAARIARRGGSIEWSEPEFILKPSADTCVNVMELLRQAGSRLTIDIETNSANVLTADIRCVGIGGVVDGREIVIVVPLKHMDGKPWWSPGEETRLKRVMTLLLESNPLAGHNLLFDTAVLLQHGILQNRGKKWFDTMVAHHCIDHSELPHDLGFVAARFFEAPRWKEDADSKSVDGVDDYWLHLYCLDAQTPVVLADGSTKLISEIVNQRLAPLVKARDSHGRIVVRRVVGWHKNRVAGQTWRQIRTTATRPHERGLICTPDHPVATQRGFTNAEDVQVGDTLYLPEPTLTTKARQAILGTLLGDSALVVSPSERARPDCAPTAALQGSHASASRLAQNKAVALPTLITLGPELPAREIVVSGRRGSAGAAQPYRSINMQQLVDLYRLVYTAGIRRLRPEVLDLLGAVGLAWWFMDDGCVQKGQRLKQNDGSRGGALYASDSVVFATQGFPREDVLAAVEWFRTHYGPTWAGADNVIRLGSAASAKLAHEIAPHVFPEQRYKLPRGEEWPAFVSWVEVLDRPLEVRVTESAPYTHHRKIKRHHPTNGQHREYEDRSRAETRYCLDVEEDHNFFTSFGLVHNCAKDVLGEMRLVAPLAERVSDLNVAGALGTDLELAPVARDMGMLGLNINEERRRKFFDTLDTTGKKRREDLCRIVGRTDFNPNATKQVSDFLFIQKKLTPPYATDGREWDELLDDDEVDIDTEDPDVILAKASTNELSLLRLLDMGVDDQTRQFVETLLSYRGIEKCKGTYIGLKWDEEGALADTHRKRGFLRTERWMGSDLSIFHPSWKIHVTPTGRWATSPNVQNWPERVVYDTDLYKASENKDGIINTRSMVEAPPGHVLVGADYAAIDLRLYAAQSGDALLLDAILNGKDPHTLNYATMMARRPEEIPLWYKRTSESKAKKYLRMIAKRFCLAEGTPVLTQRGCVPIEQVLDSDLVWDGVEWVAHDGVICNGVREVLLHDGLWATEDHEVWTEDGRCVEHGEAAKEGWPLARSGAGGRPIRFVGSHDSAEGGGSAPNDASTLREVRSTAGRAHQQPSERKVERVPTVLAATGEAPFMVDGALFTGEATLHESGAPVLVELRSTWDRVSIQVGFGGSSLGVGDAEADTRLDSRPDRQQRALRTDESAFRVDAHEQHEPAQHSFAGSVGISAGRVALQGEARTQAAVRGSDTETDSSACQRADAAQGQDVAQHRRVVRVYDILNAGPRRRFTAADRLVHNCFLVIYGGQRDKLYKTMAGDRNPDGSRSFPDLQPKDVEMWFDNWHRGHPETRKWQEAVVRAWGEYGFVGTMLDGRKRFFIGGPDPTAMPNMTIQGSAASIMNRAMKRISAECPYRGWSPLSGVILQVHDYVGLQVPKERQADAEKLLDDSMPYEQGGMKYAIERKAGQTWDQT